LEELNIEQNIMPEDNMAVEESEELVVRSKIVAYPNIARKLLKMGYHIIDLKAKKENLSATLFVFEATGNFDQDYEVLMAEFTEPMRQREAERKALEQKELEEKKPKWKQKPNRRHKPQKDNWKKDNWKKNKIDGKRENRHK